MENLNKEELQKKVIKVLESYVDMEACGGELKLDDSLNDMGIDSFKVIYMLLDLEEVFGIQISDDLLSPELFESAKSISEAVYGIINQ